MYSEEQDLSVEERAALAALPRELVPSDLLEERVVRALRAEGHFEANRRAGWHPTTALRVAAAITLFAAGVATGRYIIGDNATQSAEAPQSARQPGTPALTPHGDGAAHQVRNAETVVAQREMWL